MVVNDIEIVFQNLLDAGGFEKWKTGLLSGEWREKAKPALQAMHSDIGMIRVGTCRFLRREEMIGIDTVDYFRCGDEDPVSRTIQ